MFDIVHTPVATTIGHISRLIEAVCAANHQALGPISDDVTPFHSRAIPSISIHDYLERVAKFVCLDNDSLLAVVVYLDRISRAQIHRPSLALSPFNIHRLVITAIVVAHKFNSDIFFNNARYSKVGGIPLGEMNQLELEMLFLVKFDLKVDVAELQILGQWLVDAHQESLANRSPPFCLLTQYFGEAGSRDHQFPTPLLDPSAASTQSVPPLELTPYAVHPAHTQPHRPSQKHISTELNTPSSLRTACQSTTPPTSQPPNRENVSRSNGKELLQASPEPKAAADGSGLKRRRIRSVATAPASFTPVNVGVGQLNQ